LVVHNAGFFSENEQVNGALAQMLLGRLISSLGDNTKNVL
jgi:hypothetical protein